MNAVHDVVVLNDNYLNVGQAWSLWVLVFDDDDPHMGVVVNVVVQDVVNAVVKDVEDVCVVLVHDEHLDEHEVVQSMKDDDHAFRVWFENVVNHAILLDCYDLFLVSCQHQLHPFCI